jgi:hypothetical protein
MNKTKPVTQEELRQIVDEAYAQSQGYNDGRNYQMSNPNEPRFEDDFDCDEEPQEVSIMSEGEITLYGIASVKAHTYAQEYNPSTGTVQDKPNYHALKEGYTAGFLEGFAHRLTHTTGE